MKCTRVEKFLPLHVAGDLTGRRARRAVTKHLTTCAACRHAVDEYDASRKLLRAAALPPDFGGAFYEEIRNNVLAQIKRDRTLAPPPFARFSSLFNVRLAYAASLGLIIFAAALSFYSYTRRTDEEATRQKMIVNANGQSSATPVATVTPPAVAQQERKDWQTSQASIGRAGGTTGEGGGRGAKSPLRKRPARIESLRSGAQPNLMLAGHTPSNAGRNPRAPNSAGTSQATNPRELATGSNGGTATTELTEISRIEIQTSDPNIRIIWLAPGTDSAQPLK